VTASVAVVVPSYRDRLLPHERVAVRHLQAHLGRYDGHLVLPASSGLTLPGLERVPFDDRHFAAHRAYSRLMLATELYRRFAHYEFILVYQLDALALSDRLDEWCRKGYDYVGAPWVRRRTDGSLAFAGAGNGGFSLRRVESFIRGAELRMRLGRRFAGSGRHVAALGRRALRDPARVLQLVRDRYVYEDKFWSSEAPRLVPAFRVAPAEIAVDFAFETAPRFCFEQNRRHLPFGCHGWREHDPDFWAPHLLRPASV
jgi:hypothetical protein